METKHLQIGKARRFMLLLSLLPFMAGKTYAYDFSAVCSTGQTLYYNITNSSTHTVQLTYGYQKPTGDIVFPSTVQHDGIQYSVTSIGDEAFHYCSGFTGSLTIPNSVISIGSYAFSGCSGFTGSLTIPNSVTSIGNSAFSGCSGFTGSLTIPNSVTSIGDWAFYGCSGFTGSLTIPNSVTSIGDDAFSGCSGFTGSLTIPNSVTSIGDWAFYGCSGFTGSLTIPNSVTSIGTSVFYGCSGFTGSLTIPNSVTSIGSSAFSSCSGFTGSLTIPNSVTSIGNSAFSGCSGFTGSLTIPNSVTSIGNSAFYECSGFTGSLTIPNSVTSIGSSAFCGCSGFTGSLTIGNSVISIGDGAFHYCSGFTGSLTIGNSVTSIGYYAFEGCSGFTGSLTIPNSVTSIGNYAFNGCSGFTGSLTIGNSVTSIGNYAFSGCSGFTGSLTIPNSVTEIGYRAFYECSGFTGSLTIPNSVTSIGTSVFYGCSGFTGSLTIPNSVTSIGNYAFGGCSGLTGSLTIPNSVTSIGDWAFYGCSGLTGSLTIPNSVTSIGDRAFQSCSGFTGSLTIPNSVTEIGSWAFDGCSGFTGSLTIGNSVTSIGKAAFADNNFSSIVVETNNSVYYSEGDAIIGKSDKTLLIGCKNTIIPNDVCGIGDYALYYCSGFTGSLTIPNSVTSIGSSAFFGCSGLTGSLTIGNSVTSIGDWAFYGCSGLTGSLTIGNSVTSIGDWAFYGCSGFTGSLTIPNSVTSIGNYAFNGCIGLTGSLTIGNSVTSIGSNAFDGCSGFTGSLTIPNSVTEIGYCAFRDCSGLTSIISKATTPPVAGSNCFNGVSSSIPVYVPCGSAEAYRQAAEWSGFSNYSETAFFIVISSSDEAFGSVAFVQEANCDDNQVVVQAIPNPGYTFVNWTENGETVSTDATYTFTATADRNLVANFDAASGEYHWIPAAGLQYNMIVSGIIRFNGVEQTTTALEIGAFCGDECRGRERAIFFVPTSQYIVPITIGGSTDGDTLTFRVYDHATGQELDLTCLSGLTFVADAMIGTLNDWYSFDFSSTVLVTATVSPTDAGTVSGTGEYMPGTTATLTATANEGYVFRNWTLDGTEVSASATYSFTVTEGIALVANFDYQHSEALVAGWNWWSSYIDLSRIDGLGMLEESLGSNGYLIKSRNAFVQNYYATMGTNFWFGGLSSIGNESFYKLNVISPCTITLSGAAANPSDYPIAISSGWNWIGFPSATALPIGTAFTGFTPSDNDVLKSQTSFSAYYEGYGWWPNDYVLIPGNGFMYYSASSTPKTLTFASMRETETGHQVVESQTHWQGNMNRYADNACIIATASLDGIELAENGYEVSAFVDGECRGSGKLIYAEPIGRYVVMLTVSGNENDNLAFALYDANGKKAYRFAAESISFAADALCGTLGNPVALHFSSVTGVPEESAGTMALFPNPVDRGGETVVALPENEAMESIEIVNVYGETIRKYAGHLTGRISCDMTSGIYMVRAVTKNGKAYIGKLIIR